MRRVLWTFQALDTLFFRDGTPYNAGESSQMGVPGAFPPSMLTLQGAIRMALAQGRGWRPERGYADWPSELGDADGLGNLTLRGPYLHKGDQWLFPAPAHLLKTQAGDLVRLVPGTAETMTDLGPVPVRLPRPASSVRGARSLGGRYLTLAGLTALLRDSQGLPDEVVAPEQLWRPEPRVGIQRETGSRTVGEGQLYSSIHARPVRDLELVVEVGGLPPEWHPEGETPIRLGGEGRAAAVRTFPGEVPLPPPPPLQPGDGRLRFTVTLLTPGRYGEATEHVLRNGPPGIPGQVVSACIDKPAQVGGWDLRGGGPRPLEPLVPAGATWFYEADPAEAEPLRQIHGRCPGPFAAYGFGQILLGSWEESV